MSEKDLYEILGVAKGADIKDIKKSLLQKVTLISLMKHVKLLYPQENINTAATAQGFGGQKIDVANILKIWNPEFQFVYLENKIRK